MGPHLTPNLGAEVTASAELTPQAPALLALGLVSSPGTGPALALPAQALPTGRALPLSPAHENRGKE